MFITGALTFTVALEGSSRGENSRSRARLRLLSRGHCSILFAFDSLVYVGRPPALMPKSVWRTRTQALSGMIASNSGADQRCYNQRNAGDLDRCQRLTKNNNAENC